MGHRKFNYSTFIDKILETRILSRIKASILKKYIVREQLGYCCFCNKKLSRTNITIEHIIPVSRLPRHQARNIDFLTLSCKTCNAERNTANFNDYRLYAQKKILEPPIGSKPDTLKQVLSKYCSAPRSAKIEVITEMFKCGESVSNINSLLHISKKTIKRILKSQGLIEHIMAKM